MADDGTPSAGIDWSSLAGLIGGIINTVSSTHAASQQNAIAKQAEAERVAENARRAKESDPTNLLANIMKLKQSLTKEQQDMIVRTVTGHLLQSGQAGATGLIQEAVAEAMANADSNLFNQAATTYLNSRQQPVLRGQPVAAPFGGSGDVSKAPMGAFAALANLLKPKTPAKTGMADNTGAPQSYFDMVGAQESASPDLEQGP